MQKVLSEAQLEHWSTSKFSQEFEELKTSWNAEFNKNNARLGTVAGPGASAEGPQWVHVDCPYTNLADLTGAQPDLFSAPEAACG